MGTTENSFSMSVAWPLHFHDETIRAGPHKALTNSDFVKYAESFAANGCPVGATGHDAPEQFIRFKVHGWPCEPRVALLDRNVGHNSRERPAARSSSS
jgi:hypothetical protein